MGIDRTMNKRQQKIQAAKVRRLLARSEQVGGCPGQRC
jgi:hypothetical protein